MIFTDITAKQFWGNLRIHYSVEVHPNPKSKVVGGQRNQSGTISNVKSPPKPKKNQQQIQANLSVRSHDIDSQQAQQVISSSSVVPSGEESANIPGTRSDTSMTPQAQGYQR